jgi:S1-C subfamily serine protease
MQRSMAKSHRSTTGWNRIVVCLVASGALVLSSGSCGGPAKPPNNPGEQGQKSSKQPGGKAKKVTTMELPEGAVIGKNVTLSGFYEDDMPGGGGPDGQGKEQGDKAGAAERPGGMKTPGGPVKDVYRRVAPATVIVRSQRGYGSGVIYHPDGWVLTNHHVVAHAERDEFRWKVKIALGTLSKAGIMERRKKLYEGYVHKIDPLLDLAVVKIIDPPKNLQAIAISPKDPVPGEAVSALGHAGIGLVWAIKDGQISAVGKLSTHLAALMLAAANKKKKKAAAKTGRSAYLAKVRKKRIEQYRKFLEKKKPAQVIQSTCDISQGDSGGPLVNRQSELVGLNAFVRSGRRAKKESNFHIHVSEVRKFVKDVPKTAPQLLPNPWTDGGNMAKLGDADLDGTVDTLVMYKVRAYRIFFRVLRRRRAMGYFMDLDQDSFKGKAKLPEVKDVVDKKSFDAELIFLAHGSQLHAWYDTNGDAKMDVLLVANAYTRKVTGGYRIGKDGKLKKDAALEKGKLIRPELFEDVKLGARLRKAGRRFFTSRLLPRRGGGKDYPDPIASAGHEGRLRDYNRDGKPDTVQAHGLWSHGYVVDLDQNTLGVFAKKDSLRKVKNNLAGKPMDAEFSLIYRKRRRWAWYDTDNDGRFDLLLHGAYRPSNIVAEAWTVSADGKYTKDKTQAGRLLVQPELVKGHAAALRKIGRRIAGSSSVATGPGAGVFPDPARQVRFSMRIRDIGKLKKVAVSGRYGRCYGTLVDLDRDTVKKAKRAARKAARKAKKRGKVKVPALNRLVMQGKFDAELALVKCYYAQWAFYDTKGKGYYDLVLFKKSKYQKRPTAAYVIDKKGNITARKKPIACDGMIHPRLFKNRRLRRTAGKLGALFSTSIDASCKP